MIDMRQLTRFVVLVLKPSEKLKANVSILFVASLVLFIMLTVSMIKF